MLDLRCLFAERGDDDEAVVVMVRGRLTDGGGDADDGISLFLVESLAYWYLASCPLNDTDGGEESLSGGSESSSSLDGIALTTASVCIDRVRGIS